VRRGLAGLEWAVGIPGTIGGAVVGNAGAWGGDVASTLIRATILTPDGAIAEWPVSNFEYGYRASLLKRQNAEAAENDARNSARAIVVDAEFALQPSEGEALAGRVAEITAQRKASQPPGASCGSVFKNPPADYAGRLIEAAGLKGQRLGAVEISAVHANFMVNHGGATATEVWAMISLARRTVWEQFGVELELEIERIGDW
jgi:UDP-N-acetylmuramate dehydrogenase